MTEPVHVEESVDVSVYNAVVEMFVESNVMEPPGVDDSIVGKEEVVTVLVFAKNFGMVVLVNSRAFPTNLGRSLLSHVGTCA